MTLHGDPLAHHQVDSDSGPVILPMTPMQPASTAEGDLDSPAARVDEGMDSASARTAMRRAARLSLSRRRALALLGAAVVGGAAVPLLSKVPELLHPLQQPSAPAQMRVTPTPWIEPPMPALRSLSIVAHLDDDLLFLNPDIVGDIQRGYTVRTVYMVAWVIPDEADYWQKRELGIKQAYADMAGVANVWASHYVSIGRWRIVLDVLRDAPSVSVMFLRLPDNADNRQGVVHLRTLWDTTDTLQTTTVDGTNTFSRQELIGLLTTIMEDFGASIIRTQANA